MPCVRTAATTPIPWHGQNFLGLETRAAVPTPTPEYLGYPWAAPLGRCHAPSGLGYTCRPSELPLATSHIFWGCFSLLVQKLPVFLQEHVKTKVTEMPSLPIICLNILSVLQRCYRRGMSKNLPHLTTLLSGHTRNFPAGIKTPVASLNYHFHPCRASFKGVQGPHF